jgi:hypothetical protein
MSYAAIREALLAIQLIPKGQFSARDVMTFNSHYDELTAASGLGLWKSVTFLSGQVVEAFIERRVASVRPSPGIPRNPTLSQLISVAKNCGVLPNYNTAKLGAESITTALVIRNWAAHFRLWSEYPNEVRATQALALMLCAVQALYPRARPVFDDVPGDAPYWRRHAPHWRIMELQSIERSGNLPAFITTDAELFCDYAVQVGTLATIVHLGEQLRRLKLPLAPLARALTKHFGNVALHAADASDYYMTKLVKVLKWCNLSEHASIFAVLLPLDAVVLRQLLSVRSPAYVAFYVTTCHAAEPALFDSRAVTNKLAAQALVDTFWSQFTSREMTLSSLVTIWKKMPRAMIAQLMRDAPIAELLARLDVANPRLATSVLGLVRNPFVEGDARLVATRQRLVDGLIARLDRAELAEIANIPVFLSIIHMSMDPAALAVARSLLRRVIEASSSEKESRLAMWRILWDTLIFIEPLRADALGIAQFLLATSGRTINWPTFCLAGIVSLARPRTFRRQSRASVHVSSDVPDDADRWQVSLALLGATMLIKDDADCVTRLITAARTFDAPFPPGATEISKLLLERVADLLHAGETAV